MENPGSERLAPTTMTRTARFLAVVPDPFFNHNSLHHLARLTIFEKVTRAVVELGHLALVRAAPREGRRAAARQHRSELPAGAVVI